MPFVILETTSVNHELGKFFHPLWAKFRTSKNPGRFAQLGDLEKVKASLRDGLESNINWTNPDSKSETYPGGETCLMMAILGDYRSPTKYSVIKVNVIKSMYIGSNWNFSSSWVILGWTSTNRIILEQQLLSTPSMPRTFRHAVRLLLTQPGIDLTIRTWAGQCSNGWHGWRLGGRQVCVDLVDRLRFKASWELCDEMRELFGLPPLPPPWPRPPLLLLKSRTRLPTRWRWRKWPGLLCPWLH